MITLILGLILLAIPFLLTSLFSDRKRGFIYVLFFLLLFQTVLGLLTQALGIFYYGVIMGCTLLADIILLVIYFKIKKKFSLNLRKIDWIFIAVALISILCLYQVHYNYTGKINLATDETAGYHQVKNMVYVYPYFSDEWYAVSLVQGAINYHSLPLKNILDYNSFSLTFELFFHSFVAEIILLLGLDPLLNYTILSIFFNALIILLIYLFLRINNIPKLTSGICSLLALYITFGANLPGLWQFIPFNSGIMFFLLSLFFMEFKDVKMTFLSFILASFFYPPLFLFYFVVFIIFLFLNVKVYKEKFFKITGYSFLSLFFIVPIAYILVMISPLAGPINHIISRIFFISFSAPFIPQLNFYNIIPIFAFLLAIPGIFAVYKAKKWVLFYVFVLGVIYWVVYSFTLYRFFAEYERIVILTSIIVVIISGFGLRKLECHISEKFKKNGLTGIKVIEIALLAIFVFLVPFYTQSENWKKIIYLDPASKAEMYPKSPANNYLTQDDLRIFKDIKSKRFLSLPWKGTVIGVATSNYPLLTKQGTISIGADRGYDILGNFLNANCPGKNSVAKNLNLDYIYLYTFNCPGFEKIDQSQEGLFLYKVNLKDE